MSTQQFDKQLGWIPAIPLPFYIQKWSWRKFRFIWKAACYQCNVTFTDEKEWPAHYILHHLENDERGAAQPTKGR